MRGETTHTDGRMSHRTRRATTVLLRRSALGMTLAASTLVPLSISAPAASAAPLGGSELTLTDVSGTRVARGGAPGIVHAIVNNVGTAAATGVEVRYRLPSGLQPVPASSSAGCTTSGTLVTCAVGSIPAGGSAGVDIGVREPLGTAVLGSRLGYFLAPTSDAYDPGAGELLTSTWYHDAGVEGTDLSLCWPIENPTPNMDVAGGVCDGTNDTGPLPTDESDVLDEFPAPFSEPLVRSWQFETEITPRQTGSYRACGTMIDDGGYLAIAPVGDTLTPADVKVSVIEYDSATGAPFTLDAGRRYQVVMRVSNRGFDGIDNGADGGTLAGWDAYGIAPASEPCGADAAGVFGTADTAWVERTVADVIVVGSSDLSVLGAVESAPVDGVRQATVRIGNTGADTTSARLAFELPTGSTLTAAPNGCDRVLVSTSTTCEVDAIAPTSQTSPTGLIVSLGFSGERAGLGWTLSALSTIDADPSDNGGRLTTPTG